MKDMLGTEVVVGDTVVFADYRNNDNDMALTGGVVKDISQSEDGVVAEGVNGDIYLLSSEEFAYYTTIKDLT